MAQNNKLNRRAQAFMADHEGVTYLNALKAVDEPLHELRDLVDYPRVREFGFTNFFRLVVEQGSYAPVNTDSESSDFALIDKLGLFEYRGMWKFIDEASRRRELLKTHEVSDIWEYRELQRSGVLGLDAETMDPVFHHYDMELRAPFAPMFGMGPIGFFPVNVSSLVEIRENERFIPVTLDQLRALETGNGPVGEIIAPVYLEDHDAGNVLEWNGRYDILATSKNSTFSYDLPCLSILFKGNFDEFSKELRTKGLDPIDFDFKQLSDEDINFRQFEGNIYARQRGQSLFKLPTTQNSLLWKGRSVEESRTILEVAESIGLEFEHNGDGSFAPDSEGKISTACPFHGDADSFILQPDQGEHGSFMCYSCGRNGGPERLKSEWENRHSLDPMTE